MKDFIEKMKKKINNKEILELGIWAYRQGVFDSLRLSNKMNENVIDEINKIYYDSGFNDI